MKNLFNYQILLGIFCLMLMPFAVHAESMTSESPEEAVSASKNIGDIGGRRSMFKNYQRKDKVSLKTEFSSVFVEQYKSQACKDNPAKATVIIFAHDEDGNVVKADVYADDNKIGTAPGTFEVPACSFKLMLKAKNKYFYTKLNLLRNIQSFKTPDGKHDLNVVGEPTFINATMKPELQWSKKAEKVKSPENYCKNLKESGYSDWRLPTIDDFKTVISCPSMLSGGSCEFSIKSYKSFSESKCGEVEEEVWLSSVKGTKISFLGENETFAAASPDCPNSPSIVAITKEEDGRNSVYFKYQCSLGSSDEEKSSENYDVRCVR